MSLPPALRSRRRWLTRTLSWAAGSAVTAPAFGQSPAAPRLKLTVAAYPLVDQIVKDALPGWKAEHPGVEVEVVSRQYDDHHTAMTTALSTASGGSRHLPDVMALEASYMGRFAMGAGLLPLSGAPFDGEALKTRFVSFAFEQARNRDGQLVALPTDIGPGCLFYRQDVLAKAGVAIDEMTRSWDDYVRAGERIKARTGAYLMAHARYLKDIVALTGAPPGQSVFFDEQGQPRVDGPIFRRAFELAREVRRLKLDAVVDTWQNDWAEHLRRGRIATELSGAWMAGQMGNWVAPKTQGLWRSSPLPEGLFIGYGGTYYALPRRADPQRRALAWSLVQKLTMDRDLQLRAFKSQDAFPALLSAQDDPFFDQPVPFLGGQLARQQWRDAARRIPPRPLHRQHKFAEEVVNGELDNVLIYGKPIAQALANAQALLRHRASR